MSVDQQFHVLAMQKKINAMQAAAEAERMARIRARVRAEYSTPTRTIAIDGPIGTEPGELSASWFRSQLPTDGSPIVVRIHSEGGSVFEAFAMFDSITQYPGKKTAVVESMAFSAASLLLAAFDNVEITANGYIMLHAPHFDGIDDLDDSQRRLLDQLRSRMIGIYAARTGKPRSFIERELDREVFYDAEASIDLGLVDRVSRRPSVAVARIPARVLARIRTQPTITAAAQWRSAVDAAAKTLPRAKAIIAVDREQPGLRQKMLAEANRR